MTNSNGVMLNLLTRFKEVLNRTFSFLKGKRVLIAISGGKDSVVLTHLCYQARLNMALAHCNFGLRGKESDDDEEFVLQLADDLQLEVFIEHFDTEKHAQAMGQSIQMAARELRYEWFNDLAEQLHFDYILTAHHADDSLETFLINLSRGTGLDGLAGIPEVNDKIVRPLLSFSQEDLNLYAKSNQLKWREDSSNSLTKYLRNKIRHNVIPELKEVNPQLLENFLVTINHLKDSRDIISHAVKEVLEKVVEKNEKGTIHFSVEKLKNLPNTRAYLYEILNPYGFTAWDDVINLLESQTGKFLLSKTHKLLKNRDQLILFPLTDEKVEEIRISEKDGTVFTPMGILKLSETEAIEGLGIQTVHIDKDLLKFPLTVRQWQNGDYFYPFGMKGKKKLSKFFKDEKYSILQKEKALVLTSDGAIVWIINRRMDERFKVTNKTKKIIQITLT